MNHPIYDDVNMVESIVKEADKLLAALSTMCTKENSDVSIECQNEKFYCHRVVLKARSTVFFELLENGSHVVRVDGVKPNIMNAIIKYIYTSEVDLDGNNLLELIVASTKFQLRTLEEKCLSAFRNQINFDNVIDILIVADKLDLEQFKSVALSRINKNRFFLVNDPEFRKKMMENPNILMMLYEKLSQDQLPDTPMSTGALWTCLCGSTARGNYCSWCTYLKSP